GQHQNIGRQAVGDLLLERGRIVACDAEEKRDSAGVLHGSCDPIAIRVDDLLLAKPLVQIRELISGGENRHPRTLIDKDERLRQYREHARLSWPYLRALGDDALTFPDVLALGTDVRAFRLRLEDAYRFQRVLSVLYFQHGVRAFRNRGSGHDPNRLTALHCLGWHLPCRDI